MLRKSLVNSLVNSLLIGSIATLTWMAPLGAASDSAIADAAMRGDTAAVQSLLAAGDVDVNAPQGDGMTALHWAAFHDDFDMLQWLIGAKADTTATTRNGALQPLAMAAKNGSAAMVEALIDVGAEVNYAGASGTTALMAAALSGSAETVTLLLDQGAFVNAREAAHGQTALMFAAWENRAEAIRVLLAHGAHPGLTSNIESLIDRRFDEEGKPIPPRRRRAPGGNSAMGGMTALLFAAREGHLAAVEALVDTGVDLDQISGADASSPMVIAIANGHYAVGQYLLDHGADPTLANIDGVTPLYTVVNLRYAPVSWAPNPLTEQERVGALDLMQSLLERGADPDAQIRRKLWFSPTSHDRSWVDHAGGTPFWRAAMSSDVEAMRILVAAGANPNIGTNSGITPLMVAAGLGWMGNFSQNAPDSFMDAVEMCLELGNDINAIDEEGMSALHGAASRGDSEMVQFLVNHGARVDLIDEDGNSAADMAFGPSRFFIPKPETARLLEALGSPFQDNCRSDQCVDGKFNATAAQK